METVYLTLTIICSILLVVSFFLLGVTQKGGESKIYCYLFEHKDWVKWEKIIKNFDNIQYVRHDVFEDNSPINSYRFTLDYDGRECQIIYWEDRKSVSVHDFGKIGECLCDFDNYHSGLLREKLSEKFGYW